MFVGKSVLLPLKLEVTQYFKKTYDNVLQPPISQIFIYLFITESQTGLQW